MDDRLSRFDWRDAVSFLGVALFKALWIVPGVLLLAASEPYWHQLLLVILSTVGSGIALVGSSLINRQRQRHIERKVDDLKQATGVSRRATDQPPKE